MRKPVVDYTKLRPNNITSPEYRHLILLLGWVVYFIFYFITENLIPYESCHIIHCHLDDVIKFNEYFFIPYTFWYVLIVISLLYFMLYSVESFKYLQKFIMITQAVAMFIYIVYPSIQLLRPEEFVRDNFLTHVAAYIYSFDTPTGVCPSLHVAYSMGIMSTWLKEKQAKWPWKAFVVFACILISISTAFVKQHSVVDIFVALPVSLLAEAIVFRKYWKKKISKEK